MSLCRAQTEEPEKGGGPVRTKHQSLLENACLLRAVRALLDDPKWGPEAVLALIEHQQGYPLTKLDLLTEYAPLLLWRRSDAVELETRPDGARIWDASGREQILTQDDTIAVCFVNERGRGHVEAVGIQEIAASFRFPIAAMLTYDKTAALQWLFCVSCERSMPPIHACPTTTPT